MVIVAETVRRRVVIPDHAGATPVDHTAALWLLQGQGFEPLTASALLMMTGGHIVLFAAMWKPPPGPPSGSENHNRKDMPCAITPTPRPVNELPCQPKDSNN